ncbi:MAG: helix-turn-helix transcriptional regulator [Steroidobacteraceae bacterium]
MKSAGRKANSQGEKRPRNEGLFRTILAGSGHTLADAFANLEGEPQVEQITRHVKRDLFGARVTLAPNEGQGYWEFTRIRDDLYVVIENFAYRNPRIELVPGDGLIQFNFKVSGDLTLAVNRAKPLRFNRPSLLVWAQPTGIDISEWTAPSAHERSVAISFRPEFLTEEILTSIVDVPEQLQVFMANSCEKLNYCQLPMSAHMFEVAMSLINNPYTGALALVYTEAITLELLCIALGSFRSSFASSSEEFTERELYCLHAARDVLMRQYAPPPSIRQLARLVGMAESPLMKSFKVVFGETISNFGLRCRMEHALTILRDQHQSVAIASEAVGYSHPTSFATAFRRHFGMRPIDVRRLRSRVKEGS